MRKAKAIVTNPEFDLTLKMIKLSKIKDHPINPAMRPKRIDDLKKDGLIQEGRLVNPLKVVKDGTGYILLDGHRRKAALKHAAEDKDAKIEADPEVPCIVYSITSKSPKDRSRIYGSLNTVQKHKGDEKAAIYLVDPSFLTNSERKMHMEAESGLTKKNFELCVDNEVSPSSLWSDVKTTASRCRAKAGKAEFQGDLIAWLFPGKGKIRISGLRSFKSEWTNCHEVNTRQRMIADKFVEAVQNNEEFDPFGTRKENDS